MYAKGSFTIFVRTVSGTGAIDIFLTLLVRGKRTSAERQGQIVTSVFLIYLVYESLEVTERRASDTRAVAKSRFREMERGCGLA